MAKKSKQNRSEKWDPNTKFFECEKAELDMATKLVESATEDRAALQLIYNDGGYSRAVFHLEQAVEMCIKADMLLSGSYSTEDVKSFRHEVMTCVYNFKMRMGDYHKWGTDTGLAKLYDAIRQNPDLVIRASGPLITQIMQDGYLKNNEFRARLLSKGLKEDDIKQTWMGYFGINVLALIVQYHESTTRYPDSPNGELKPSDYKPGLGIVDALPFLVGELDDLIAFLQSNISEQNRRLAKSNSKP